MSFLDLEYLPGRASWGYSMRLWPKRFIFPFVLQAVCLAIQATAQTTVSGGLAGVIRDSSNAVVPDADVEIRENNKGTVQSTKTDITGLYQFFFVTPGRYTLTATHFGFQEEKRIVDVLLGPPVSV